MPTKITSTSIRIALSYQFNTFEITANIENESGITTEEVDAIRKVTQSLAQNAVDEYKLSPNSDVKSELKKAEQKIKDIAKMVRNEKPEIVDTKLIEQIQSLPPYPSKKV